MKSENRIQNAIRHIQTAADIDPWAAEMAAGALEKQIPRKPKETVHPEFSGIYLLYCPKCGAGAAIRVRSYIACGDNKYCGKCGQAIDFQMESEMPGMRDMRKGMRR